jgi:hypothetical protein
MDGCNVSLGTFVPVVWVFLNVCPEAATINPFIESKQTWRGRNGNTSREA